MTSRFKLAAVLLVLGALAACGPSTGVGGAAGDASAATVAANQAMAQQLRLDDPQGFEDARRGFIAAMGSSE